MRVAERTDLHDAQTREREVAVWRHEVRLQALAHLANRAAKPPRWVRIGVGLCLLLLLATSLIGLRRATRPKISPNEMTIEIRLIDESPPEPSLPVPAPGRSPSAAKAMDGREQPPGRSPSAAKAMDGREQPPGRSPSAAKAMDGREQPPGRSPSAAKAMGGREWPIAARPIRSPAEEAIPESPAPAYRVFNPDGSVILPAAAANQGMQATFVAQSTAAAPIMRHQRPLKVRPNHFAQNWQAPDGETIVGAFVRERLTAETQFMTPWGTLVKCGVVFLAGGCAWGPPPVWQSMQTWRPATALDEE